MTTKPKLTYSIYPQKDYKDIKICDQIKCRCCDNYTLRTDLTIIDVRGVERSWYTKAVKCPFCYNTF
jgi:hypothetical protein